jgi:hypothetical protein
MRFLSLPEMAGSVNVATAGAAIRALPFAYQPTRTSMTPATPGRAIPATWCKLTGVKRKGIHGRSSIMTWRREPIYIVPHTPGILARLSNHDSDL